MKGVLIKENGEWSVKYGEEKETKIYPLCPDSINWVQKNKDNMKDGVEVIFDEIVKGEYCITKEMMIKNYFAKIIVVED